MYSGIFNLKGAKVEQLNYTGTVLVIESAGITTTTIPINLEAQRLYVINRIKFNLNYFVNPDLETYAFPKFEQFVFAVHLKASLGVTNNQDANVLFTQMQFNTIDGISDTWLFAEPFVFRADNSTDNSLFVQFSDNGCVFDFLSLAVPPAGSQTINIHGSISFEGYSAESSADFLGEVVK